MPDTNLDSFNTCKRCSGAGVTTNIANGVVVSENPCLACNGTGHYKSGKVDATDLMDKMNDILDKCNDIFEKVNE